MPLLMFSAIAGCGLLFYVGYRYARSHPLTRKEEEIPKEEEAPKEIAKGD